MTASNQKKRLTILASGRNADRKLFQTAREWPPSLHIQTQPTVNKKRFNKSQPGEAIMCIHFCSLTEFLAWPELTMRVRNEKPSIHTTPQRKELEISVLQTSLSRDAQTKVSCRSYDGVSLCRIGATDIQRFFQKRRKGLRWKPSQVERWRVTSILEQHCRAHRHRTSRAEFLKQMRFRHIVALSIAPLLSLTAFLSRSSS